MSQQVIITAEGFGTTLVLNLGQEKPSDAEGYAKWNEVPRPRRRSVLEYDGESLLKQTFTVMLDRAPDGDAEDVYRQLRGMAARSGLLEPTVIRLSGPLSYTDLRYVITGFEENLEVQRRRLDGRRCRWEVKLTVTEHLKAELIVQGLQAAAPPAATTSPAQAAAKQGPFINASAGGKLAYINNVITGASNKAPKTYNVKRGDTLSAIAARELGNANRWKEIADANGVRDPRKLQIGQVLRIPA